MMTQKIIGSMNYNQKHLFSIFDLPKKVLGVKIES
jgi:hypothetical protein